MSSTVTGHQRSEGRGNRKQYLDDRNKKIKQQREEKKVASPGPLANVRLYINGYLSDTTDIEMKRIVILAGGEIMFVFLSLLMPPIIWPTHNLLGTLHLVLHTL